ncbi:protein ripply2.2-like isoform X1 [Hyla sarda]|uniref:protein ripply2.2-like isoform X1 n=1 Tax=Hyla sarda TaxID=327740 RepID=UPI0024C26000|nr:protein ripply2.2-like isoform X1 [Hyla sarda]
MEPTLVTEQGGSEERRLSSLDVECLSCRCLRRRTPYPSGCIRVTRGAEHRLHATFWRPWMQRSSRKSLPQSLPYAKGLCENRQAGQKPVDYNHPVRLFWPRSKPLDLMYVEAEDLLKNFPVQATLSFYDSESDTDNDEENPEEEHDSGFESD